MAATSSLMQVSLERTSLGVGFPCYQAKYWERPVNPTAGAIRPLMNPHDCNGLHG
jgi:hypothetical protein